MELNLGELARLLPGRNSGAAVFAGLAQVRAYWEALRKEGGIPDRTQLDPRGFGGVLDRVFMAERIGMGLVQVRIAGSALTEVAGVDLRGLPLSCLFAAEARDTLALALEPVTEGRSIVELDLGTTRGGAGVQGRLLLLPVSDGPDRRLVLGCLGLANGLLCRHPKLTILRQQGEQVAPVTPPRPVAAPQHRTPYLTLVRG